MSETRNIPHVRKATCPDCGQVVDLDRLTTFGVFLECPECAVGSPALAWLKLALTEEPLCAERMT